MLLSQAGSGSAWLRAIPSEPCFTISPFRFQIAVRRRLRWPLPLSVGKCTRSCLLLLDRLGDHLCSCMKSGKVKLRSRVIEQIWARILREAGGRVRENVLLRDSGIPNIDPADGRKIEIVVTRLPIAHGIPVAVDATIVSPLHANGIPHPIAHSMPGSSLVRAERLNAVTYLELVDSSVLRLETVA